MKTTNMEFIGNDYRPYIDIDSGFVKCTVDILLGDVDNEQTHRIGHAILYLIDVWRYENWNALIDVADGISGDLLSVIEGIEKDAEGGLYQNLTVLDTLWIDDTYRGLGFGKESLKEIIQYLGIIGQSHTVLHAEPIVEEGEPIKVENRNWLVEFYQSLGFNKVESEAVEENEVLMERNL